MVCVHSHYTSVGGKTIVGIRERREQTGANCNAPSIPSFQRHPSVYYYCYIPMPMNIWTDWKAGQSRVGAATVSEHDEDNLLSLVSDLELDDHKGIFHSLGSLV